MSRDRYHMAGRIAHRPKCCTASFRSTPLTMAVIAGVSVLWAFGPAFFLQPAIGQAADKSTQESAKTGPVLRGRIVDSAGKPVPDVNVVLYGGVATRFRGQEARTDANGEYRFDPLHTGAMLFPEGKAAEYGTGMQLIHDEFVPADGKSWRDINVPNIAGHNEVRDITMARGGRIAGRVVDDSGAPVPRLNLRVHNGFVDGRRNSDFSTYVATDDVGRFRSEPVFPGQYVVEINDSRFQGKYRYPRIGKVLVSAGETVDVKLTTRELPTLQDPFRLIGTAIGEDGQSMVYGGVGVRGTGGKGQLRTSGGGIDGRNVFGLVFGPIERSEVSEKAPFGVGTQDIELFGNNRRLGYKLVRRVPAEPLRITDDPDHPEVKDGFRYIRPNQPVEFQLVFDKDD